MYVSITIRATVSMAYYRSCRVTSFSRTVYPQPVMLLTFVRLPGRRATSEVAVQALVSPREFPAGSQFIHMPRALLPEAFSIMKIVLPARKIRGPACCVCNFKLNNVSKDGIYESGLGLYVLDLN